MTGERILIVEDETIVARNNQKKLEQLGYQVTEIATSAEEAVSICREQGPDLVLMDIKLDGEGDGVEAAAQIQREMDIPVIYLTALTDEDTMQRAKITEPFGYIHKPVDVRDIRNTIEMALYRHEMTRNLRESEARFRALLETLPNVAVQGYDRKGNIRFWNRASEEMFGYSKDETLGRNIMELIYPERERGAVRERLARGVKEEGRSLPSEKMFLCKDGTEIPVYSSHLYLTSLGGEPEFFNICIYLSPFKMAQEALMKSEMRYRALTENLNVGVYRNTPGPAGKFLEANTAVMTMYGYKDRDEFFRLKVRELYSNQDDRIRLGGKLRENGSVMNEEIAFRRKDGSEFIGSISAVAVMDSKKNVKYYEGIIEDITERKDVEKEQQKSLSLLNATLESTADGILVTDGKGEMVKFNRQFKELWKIPDELLLSREEGKVLNYLSGQLKDPLGFLKKVRELYDSPEGVSFDIMEFKDDRIFERYSKPQTIEKEIVGRVWSFRDVTGKIAAKRELELEKVYFEALFQKAPEAVILADNEGRVRRINEAFTKMFGYSNEEAKGEFVDDLIAPGSIRKSARELTRKVTRGEIERKETIRYRKDGTVIPVSIIGSPIFVGDKQVGVHAIYRDISERKRAEEERERLNKELLKKNKELQHIVYTTSHDLRSPLVNIKGFSEEAEKSIGILTLLIEKIEIPRDQKEVLDILAKKDIPEAFGYIKTSIRKIESLVSGLLRLSRLGSATLNIEELDMNGLIRRVQGDFEYTLRETGVSLDIGDLPSCIGDETQINQVFSNLLDNALKYLDPSRPGKVAISGTVEGDRAIYSVSDNGIGIPEEHLDRIFHIFHQINETDTKGEGLGLTAVRRILDRNQGRIWVEAKEGKGSTFNVSLPAA